MKRATPMTAPRRPAADLVEAIVENMRTNLEELRYTTLAPSRYVVYLSPAEHARLEGILPRLQAEAMRALEEELARLGRRSLLRRVAGRWLGPRRGVENAGAAWHVEFLPDLDGDLAHDQDLIVQSDLLLPPAPELGGERTRRVTTVRAASGTIRHEATVAAPAASIRAFARLVYDDRTGPHQHDVVRDSTTIGRGGTMFPVDVRVAAADDVSREHARIQRDPATGDFHLIDLSTHGTTIDGQAVPKGFDEAEGRKRENGRTTPLPSRARIGLAGALVLTFERLR